MKIPAILFLFILFLTAVIIGCGQKNASTSLPELTMMHGALFDADGPFHGDGHYIVELQEQLIKNIERNLEADTRDVLHSIKRIVSDEVLANALYIDILIDRSKLPAYAEEHLTNSALRWYYMGNIQEDPIFPEFEKKWAKGIKPEKADELEKISIPVYEVNSNKSYRQDCRDGGVPVPSNLFNSDWENLGLLENQSGFSEADSELQIYLSNEPKGFCLSLTRIAPDDDTPDHLDLICFGIESNNACFFESIDDRFVYGDKPKISDLAGGDNIGYGFCNRCHVGENAFIVHPQDPAFAQAALRKSETFGTPFNLNGSGWYTPIAVPSWPPNPPPVNNMDQIEGERKCSTCHTPDYGGRFADLTLASDSGYFLDYCENVFRRTIGENINNSFQQTMPMGDVPNDALYLSQINFLKNMCNTNPDKGVLVPNDFVENPKVISSPTLVKPITNCAKAIFVKNVIKGANVELTINGKVVGNTIAINNFEPIQFNINGINLGDTVEARQIKGEAISAYTLPSYAQSISSIYPNGLPQPSINPNLVYECAKVVSVRYDIPGLEVKVMKNNLDTVLGITFRGHKTFKPGNTPFKAGDEFIAQVIACGVESPLSSIVTATEAIRINSQAVINEEILYPGQELINITNLTYGTTSTIIRNDVPSTIFSTPLSWTITFLNLPDLMLTDQLSITQELCGNKTTPTVNVGVHPCTDLPAPVIRDPYPGDVFVYVEDLIYGSRTRIYDENGNEIGDGTGDVITLNRALVDGENITVTTELGDCLSNFGFQIEV